MRWTNTVEAVVAAETSQAKGQWKIGDAIRKDLDLADSAKTADVTDQSRFGECADRLEAAGHNKYTTSYLRKLYETARAFPRDKRDDRYSWDVHQEAGTPANLKQAASALNKLRESDKLAKSLTSVTQYNVRRLMQEWREKEAVERNSRKEAAAKEEAAAKREAAKAAERALKAKDKAEKKKARDENAAAKKAAKEAAQRRKDNTGTPGYNADVQTELQDESTLRAMAIYFSITLSAKKVEKEIKLALGNLDKISEYLTPTQAAEIEHSYKQVITLAQQVVSIATRKPHIKLVPKEGAA